MARVTPVPDSPAGAPAFELERFEWAAPGRIEVVGRWSAIRGRRFVRPTLTLRGDGGAYRLLALLEHKPWAPNDGEAWIAAFPWEGEPLAFESANLAVATGIELELPPPGAARGSHERLFRAVTRVPAEEHFALPPEERAGRERAHALELMKERDAALAERDEALGALRVTALELDAVTRERDAALAERDTALAERDTTAAELAAARSERDAARMKLERAREAVDDAEAERDRAEIERDRARTDRPPAPEQDELIAELIRERDAALRARDAAIGVQHLPARQVSPIVPGELRMPWLAVWAPRLVGIGIFVILFLALLVLLGS